MVLAYQALVDAKLKPLNDSLLGKFKQLVQKGCGSQTKHAAKVENHGIDSGLQQVYALRVFPDLPVDKASWMALPNQLLQNWLQKLLHLKKANKEKLGFLIEELSFLTF